MPARRRRPEVQPGTSSTRYTPALLAAQPDVEQHIVETAGPEGLDMARCLETRGPSTDLDLIAAHPDQDAGHVRRTLYALQDARAAQYTKDTDGAGWDTFTWHLCTEDVRDLLARRAAPRATPRFAPNANGPQSNGLAVPEADPEATFACQHGHPPSTFSAAFDRQFRCPTCQEPMTAFAALAAMTERPPLGNTPPVAGIGPLTESVHGRHAAPTAANHDIAVHA